MISLIIPVRDEPGLSEFLFRLHEVMEGIPGPYEVLVIRGDRETLHNPIPPLPHQREYKCYGDSLERAILLGFSVARGDSLVVMDADGSHPPTMVPALLRQLETNDLVVASRFLLDSRFEQSLFRRVVSYFFIAWARLWGSKLSDPMSGLFALRKSHIDNITFRPLPWKVALEAELKGGTKIKEIPMYFKKRASGVSKASIRTGLKLMWELMWL